MSYGYVPDSVWVDLVAIAKGDPYVHAIALYLWTCRHKRVTGLFYLPVDYVVSDLGYTRDDVARTLQQLHDAGWLRWDEQAGWVFVREYAAHNMKGAYHPNDNRLHAVRQQLAEAATRAPRLADEWTVLYADLLPIDQNRKRAIGAIGSRIQSDRGDQTVRRGGPPPFEGGGHPPSKGGATPPVGIPWDPHQYVRTTGTTDRTAAPAADLPVETVENRPIGSAIQSAVYQPVADEQGGGHPPSLEQQGLPLDLTAVRVRSRSPDELAREPAPDQNCRVMRLAAYEAFEVCFPDGYPADGPQWTEVGVMIEYVSILVAQRKIDYDKQRLTDAVDHVLRMRKKGVGGVAPRDRPALHTWRVATAASTLETVTARTYEDALRLAQARHGMGAHLATD